MSASRRHLQHCFSWSPVKDLKSSFFSNICCKACNRVSSSKYWRCSCHNLWYKCPTRFKSQPCRSLRGIDEKMCRKRKSLLTDNPPPKKQQVGEELFRTRVVDEVIRTHCLDPNICPKLAAKFPHLARYRPERILGGKVPEGTGSGSGCTGTNVLVIAQMRQDQNTMNS